MENGLVGDVQVKISEMVETAHATAVSKGWWDEERSPAEALALIHSEVSEALECLRVGEVADRWHEDGEDMYAPKPAGFVTELADVLIRIGDLCGRHGLDLEAAVVEKMRYNMTRGHRHGGKKL